MSISAIPAVGRETLAKDGVSLSHPSSNIVIAIVGEYFITVSRVLRSIESWRMLRAAQSGLFDNVADVPVSFSNFFSHITKRRTADT